jgi:hypothetical protein
LRKYATISIPVELKKRLEEMKGEKEWANFSSRCALRGSDLKVRKPLRSSDNFSPKTI